MGHARRWSWLLVLLVGGALFELVRGAIVGTGNPNLVPALILLGAAVIPTAFVVFIAGRRLVFAVSGGTVMLTALVGGVIGVVAAGLLEYGTLRRLGTLLMLGVGLIEEFGKLLVPAAVLLLVRRNRHPADGLLLGVASGAGFAVLETMGSAFGVLIKSSGNLAVVDNVLFLRGILSPAAHMTWTGLAAAALWYAAAQGWRAAALLRFLGATSWWSCCTPPGTSPGRPSSTSCSPSSAWRCSPPPATASRPRTAGSRPCGIRRSAPPDSYWQPTPVMSSSAWRPAAVVTS